jgi:hypothetical protein
LDVFNYACDGYTIFRNTLLKPAKFKIRSWQLDEWKWGLGDERGIRYGWERLKRLSRYFLIDGETAAPDLEPSSSREIHSKVLPSSPICFASVV